jgi:hypothetical protein
MEGWREGQSQRCVAVVGGRGREGETEGGGDWEEGMWNRCAHVALREAQGHDEGVGGRGC